MDRVNSTLMNEVLIGIGIVMLAGMLLALPRLLDRDANFLAMLDLILATCLVLALQWLSGPLYPQ